MGPVPHEPLNFEKAVGIHAAENADDLAKALAEVEEEDLGALMKKAKEEENEN